MEEKDRMTKQNEELLACWDELVSLLYSAISSTLSIDKKAFIEQRISELDDKVTKIVLTK